jgi:pyruvate/2-oxoglutarate/acetoin dehydrogenase E1 component
MPRELPYIAAIEEAIRQEMDRDETVLLFGQNIATTENDPFLKAFGHDRVRVTPISETAEIGMAVGAALAGYGFTAGWAGQHTGSIYGMFMGVPGLKIALPATAADAKGLMATAIRDDNPVVFFHHYLLTLTPGEVPEGEHLVPFGSAAIRRPGGDVTIVATGWMVHRALAAAERLAGEGVSAEVIDPRTLAPLDTATVIESVSKTGHLVLVDQATRHASASAVIAAEVADAGFGYLKAPIKQVTGLDTPIPYSKPMEEHVLPNEDKIVEAVRQVLSTTLVT